MSSFVLWLWPLLSFFIYCKWKNVFFLFSISLSYIFGGGYGSNWDIIYDTLICYDPSTRRWNTVKTTGPIPDSLIFNSSLFINPFLIVFPGIKSDETYSKSDGKVYFLDTSICLYNSFLDTFHWFRNDLSLFDYNLSLGTGCMVENDFYFFCILSLF